MGSSSTLVNEISSEKSLPNAPGPEQASPGKGATTVQRAAFVSALPAYLFFCLLLLSSAMWLPSVQDPCSFAVLRDKHRILEHAASPKLIFIGGSNLLYGLDGERMQRKLGWQVVNMGMCMGIPLAYMFEEIKYAMHQGDIVVFSPEPPSLTDQYSRAFVLNRILDIYPQSLQWMIFSDCATFEQKALLLNHLRMLGVDKLGFVITHIGPILKHTCRWREGVDISELNGICAAELDGCGGLIWHLRQTQQNNFDANAGFGVPDHLDRQTQESINDFANYCRSHGCRLVLIPPPVPRSQFVKASTQLNNLRAECQSRLSVPFVAGQQRYVFPDRMIFNCNFHLNKVGRKLRTDKLIEDLQPLTSAPQLPQATAKN